MSPRASRVFVLLIGAIACRRDVSRLDDVQKMAYGVKPAVVRISAYATAQFHYPPSTLDAIARELGIVRRDGTGEGVVETGAGGSGSGFIIHPDGWILTSGHVIARTRDNEALQKELLRNGAISALLKHFPVDELRRLYRGEALEQHVVALAAEGKVDHITTVNEVELSNGEKMAFKIERYSPALTERGADLALLRVARKNLPALQLGDSEGVRIGDSVWSIGYPEVASSTDDVIGGWLSRESDLEATLSNGTITAIKHDITNTPVFQSNVGIYRGNSGGPAVNREGEVIGISTWGHTDAEQIKFLVPINVAKRFVGEAKVAYNTDGAFNLHWQKALNAAADGNWSLAKGELARASTLFPSSPDLIRFSRDTDRALQSMPLWRRHPVATGAVGVAALGVLAAIFIPLASRRPRIPKDVLTASTVETMISPTDNRAARLLGRFTILNGSRAGERLGLGGSGIRIGRESTICEIVLENPKVSRLHAEVVSIDGKVLLIDRNSSNGTYVNDQKIDKRFLKDGDIIYFGGRNAIAVAYHA
ncbi:MAG TPA: trypsin-like peptidase domain-containing protein [Thermoanaerobaculia bacterium]|nr:trypsin-like peptidase domain-containing protein [Thermoanaerobaculia bacterium]